MLRHPVQQLDLRLHLLRINAFHPDLPPQRRL